MTNYPQTDTACIPARILESSNTLPEAKLKVDASRAVLQLVNDHLEHGLEIRPELIGSLLYITDVSLAEASDAICNALCGEGRV